ncbi:hypothetical protein PoB_001303100 [Plakobranchus ocellatus]|uniref:Uncharacterized protein n=1 Tax=Plakobranchus ocellatus TaxID=259542 RepID=A0AAV3YGU6_9GAST|nr:hypothetical protein PoB_001303100 [Plakobranchus ocellatus]
MSTRIELTNTAFLSALPYPCPSSHLVDVNMKQAVNKTGQDAIRNVVKAERCGQEEDVEMVTLEPTQRMGERADFLDRQKDRQAREMAIGGTIDDECDLRSAETLLSKVGAPPQYPGLMEVLKT